MDEKEDSELPADLRAFIDQLIVPLLVGRLEELGHLYSTGDTQYDTTAVPALAA